MVMYGLRARWVGKKEFGAGKVVRRQIKSPCTTTSMPFDFNPNASNKQAKGIFFTFQ
jgi:hypothetical protein